MDLLALEEQTKKAGPSQRAITATVSKTTATGKTKQVTFTVDPENPPPETKEPETFSEQRELDYQQAQLCLEDYDEDDEDDDYGQEEMYREEEDDK